MPLKTYETKADFDAEFELGAESATGHPNTRPEVVLRYNRAVLFSEAQQRASKFISILNIQPTDKVLILGAGFGWTVEALEQQGIIDVVGVDISTYINTTATSTEETDINSAITAVGLDPTIGEGFTLKNRFYDGGNISRTKKGIKNEQLSTQQSRNTIKQALGNKNPDIAITENLIESFTDIEILDYVSRITSFSASIRIAHLVLTSNVSNRTDLNMKTLSGWKALLPTHVFIENGTFKTL